MTHVQEAKLEKMTPSEHGEAASSKSNKKVYWEHGHKPSLDQEKVTPLEVTHLDEAQIYEDTPKLDAEHMALLRPKRLSRIRHARCKAWAHEHSLTLDMEEVAWAQQNGLILDPQEDYMDARLNDHMDAPEEEALIPEDSLTRLYALEEARGLDQEVKHYKQPKEQIHGPY